jgi:hypothetical protein
VEWRFLFQDHYPKTEKLDKLVYFRFVHDYILFKILLGAFFSAKTLFFKKKINVRKVWKFRNLCIVELCS